MPDSSPNASSVLSLIADDMRAVDAVIARRLASGVPLVAEVSRYIINSGGKRLRPALLLLICGALGYRGDQRFNLAAVVERSLVICLPGKPSGAVECLGFVTGAIPHCVEVLQEIPTSC